jgi:hypothetical protein
MAELLEPLVAEGIYHIYNQSTGDELLFTNDKDYFEFLTKLKKYVLCVGDIFSYCLLPNHYHLVERIKAAKDLLVYFAEKTEFKKTIAGKDLSLLLSRQFSDCFNSYAKYYNYTHARRWTLFRRAFRRKKVEGSDYLKTLICYVNRNAVDCDMVKLCSQWKHSSYNALLSVKATLLQRDEVIEMFDDVENFKYCCSRPINLQMDM